jgi:hypothetical protein
MIIRKQPNQEPVSVAEFRRRSDAEGHLRVLKQTMPKAEFVIVFEYRKGIVG